MLVQPLTAFGQQFIIAAHPNHSVRVSNAWLLIGGVAGGGTILTGAVAFMIGLPARRRSELEHQVALRTAALKESEERYRMLTESMRDVVWSVDTETQRYTYISPTVTGLLGYQPEDLLGLTVGEVLGTERREEVEALIAQQTEEARLGQRDDQVFTVTEIEQTRRDGTRVWTEVITSFQHDPGTGKVTLRGVTRDITERRHSEDELRSHLKELKRWYEVTRERETRVLELKREINILLNAAHKPERYANA
jgi:PAS domain S-box-containing protein